ncbi:MAG TPA: hypothetical protein VLB80_02640 [Candidatus Babeliales bacterium]|nr:hypothetical protein [Candidatus Babeliales bacterium]
MRKYILIVATLLLMIVIGLRWNSATFFSVEKYRCSQSNLLSDACFSAINDSLGILLQKNLSAHAIIDHLKEQFPVLTAIELSYRPEEVAIKIHSQKPLCCINTTLVLTSYNKLLSRDFFSIHAIEAIPKITVLHDALLKKPLIISSVLQSLPVNFYETYNLELINEHCIHLIDKKYPQFIIVFSVDQEKLLNTFDQCVLIKQNIDTRNGFNKGITWIADTRFAHYIIAYKT